MTDVSAAYTSNGAQTAVQTERRRRIARASFSGDQAELHFDGGIVRKFSVSAIPGAESLKGMGAQLALYGVIAVLQTAYSSKQIADPVAACDDKWSEIKSGRWSPGTNYAGREAEPDALAVAVANWRSKNGKPMSPEQFDTDFVPRYMEKTGIKSVAAAKRAIGMHKEVATERARILADRARDKAKDASKGGSSDDLLAML